MPYSPWPRINFVSASFTVIDIQNLMLTAGESCFGKRVIFPIQEIQFLTNRRAVVYCSRQTIKFERYLAVRSCWTAPYSPQSNGMAEAFIRTIKKNYVYTSDCSSVENVCKTLKQWTFDYNNAASYF